MKTQVFIETSGSISENEVLNQKFTANEKKIMLVFFHAYIKKYKTETFEEHEKMLNEKINYVKSLGFEPEVFQETIFKPIDNCGNMRINFGYKVIWPNNKWCSFDGSQNLAHHYNYKSAFLNESSNIIEMQEAEDIHKIISRAIDQTMDEKKINELTAEIKLLKKKLKKFKSQHTE